MVDSLEPVPLIGKVDRSVSHWAELVLGDAADGAYPVIGEVFKGSAGSYA